MNYGSLIFLAALVTMAMSWGSLVLVPQLQLGGLQPAAMKLPAPDYPSARPGLAQRGLQVYRSLGCAECHTQQVRPEAAGADLERGWGPRRTVARDFLFDHPVMPGRLRVGPDLANIGLRQAQDFSVPWEFETATNHTAEVARRLYVHLYDPRLLIKDSPMPSYRYLFAERELPLTGSLEPEAILLKAADPDKAGTRQLIPSYDARALVSYLLSLRCDANLFEAPLPPPPAKPTAQAAATNSVPAPTNAPPK